MIEFIETDKDASACCTINVFEISFGKNDKCKDWINPRRIVSFHDLMALSRFDDLLPPLLDKLIRRI